MAAEDAAVAEPAGLRDDAGKDGAVKDDTEAFAAAELETTSPTAHLTPLTPEAKKI